MLLTVQELREHVTTSLPDDAVLRLLDAAESAIAEWTWDEGQPVVQDLHGDRVTVITDHPVGSIESIAEVAADGATTPLDAATYRASDDYLITRIGGTFPALVRVTYVPRDNLPMRVLTQVNLVKKAAAYEGVQGQRLGDWSGDWGSAPFAEAWREDLANLREPQLLVIG